MNIKVFVFVYISSNIVRGQEVLWIIACDFSYLHSAKVFKYYLEGARIKESVHFKLITILSVETNLMLSLRWKFSLSPASMLCAYPEWYLSASSTVGAW